MNRIIRTYEEIDFRRSELETMPLPGRILMARPDHFDVTYVINPHMADHVGKVNRDRALEEWKQVRDEFREAGMEVTEIPGHPGLPDLVFTANQSLPYLDRDGDRRVIMSRMHTAERQREVPILEEWFRDEGYRVHRLESSPEISFEGMGDAIWHFNRRLLWGGYGFRTSPEAYEEISRIFPVPVILLELTDERFYHLDTCFSILNESSVLICPGAFRPEGIRMIEEMFDTVIMADPEESAGNLAVNASCPDGRQVLMQEGNPLTAKKLTDHGFTVRPIRTDEFLKSGGSVYCMKLQLW